MEPMYVGPPGPALFWIVAVIAIVGCVVGIAWIHRILRDPDDGPSNWRSHR